MRQLLVLPELLLIPAGYPKLLQDLKIHIRAARLKAALAVNRELVLLYWSIGREISSGFTSESRGLKIIDRLAQDLQAEFPGVQGFGGETSATYVLSRRLGQSSKVCNNSLQQCPGIRISGL